MPDTKCVVVLLGLPGSGKTTLARGLASLGHVAVIEMGNLLDHEIRGDTPLGRKIKPYKAAGQLVPSELVQRVLSTALGNLVGEFFLFDGFPRSEAQTNILFRLLKDHRLELCAVVILNLDPDTACQRISDRRICTKCGTLYNLQRQSPRQAGVCDRCGGKLIQREDDRPEVVHERLMTYQRETLPVLEFFRKDYGHLVLDESAATPVEELVDRVWRRL